MSFITHLNKIAAENKNFRQVLYTGAKSQLVAMNIPVGGDIGAETHAHVEQVLYIQSGEGKTILDGVETVIGAGDIVIVSPGVHHNIVNTGTTPLTIATVYAPPNHVDGTVHATKADAEADVADEAFGATVV